MRPVERWRKRYWPPEGTKAWRIVQIRKGLEQADAGMFATDEEVEAAFDERRRPRVFRSKKK